MSTTNNVREVKRAIRRIEFCLEYVITGKYERALRCRRGGQSQAAIFIASEPWKALREQVLVHYGRVCMSCGSEKSINVDHIYPKSLFPHLALTFNNMQVLCWPCNKRKGATQIVDYRKLGDAETV